MKSALIAILAGLAARASAHATFQILYVDGVNYISLLSPMNRLIPQADISERSPVRQTAREQLASHERPLERHRLQCWLLKRRGKMCREGRLYRHCRDASTAQHEGLRF